MQTQYASIYISQYIIKQMLMVNNNKGFTLRKKKKVKLSQKNYVKSMPI